MGNFLIIYKCAKCANKIYLCFFFAQGRVVDDHKEIEAPNF